MNAQFTPWFSKGEKPVYAGWYECREWFLGTFYKYTRYWTGSRWAEKKHGRTVYVPAWRGLANPPKQSKGEK